MLTIKSLRCKRGVLLIICLLLLLVLASLGVTVASISATNNKASKYVEISVEARQKADAIANFALRKLESLDHNTDLVPCGMSKSCLIWDSTAPASAFATTSNTTTKQWWHTYAQDYSNPTQLNALQTAYNPSNDNIVANYFITQEALTTDSDDYNIRTLKIVAYATDSTGKVAAVKEKFYKFVVNCKTVNTPSTQTCSMQSILFNNNTIAIPTPVPGTTPVPPYTCDQLRAQQPTCQISPPFTNASRLACANQFTCASYYYPVVDMSPTLTTINGNYVYTLNGYCTNGFVATCFNGTPNQLQCVDSVPVTGTVCR